MVLRMQGVGLMTDLELEKRLCDAEHNIDRLYVHVLMLSAIALVGVMFLSHHFYEVKE